MPTRLGSVVLPLLALSVAFAGDDQNQNIALSVPPGSPLRLYLTKRIPKRAGAPVQAKTLEPVFAFDREVVPVGTDVLGRVSRVQPVPKWQRFRAILGGDFTPLRRAQVEFTNLSMSDGRRLPIHTVETVGLNSIYTPKPPKKKPPKAGQTPVAGSCPGHPRLFLHQGAVSRRGWPRQARPFSGRPSKHYL